MYELILAIVPKHRDEELLDVAKKSGANGGTILHGRSVCSSEGKQVLGITIQPEKEIVLILVKKERTEHVLSVINAELNFDQPHQGMAIVLEAEDVIGLRGLL